VRRASGASSLRSEKREKEEEERVGLVDDPHSRCSTAAELVKV
jgi:hypothetical protein